MPWKCNECGTDSILTENVCPHCGALRQPAPEESGPEAPAQAPVESESGSAQEITASGGLSLPTFGAGNGEDDEE